MQPGHLLLLRRASVATQTRLAPAAFSTRAHSRAVAPLVIMSSTTSTSRPRTSAATSKAPRRFRRRSVFESSNCAAVCRTRFSAPCAAHQLPLWPHLLQPSQSLIRQQPRLVVPTLPLARSQIAAPRPRSARSRRVPSSCRIVSAMRPPSRPGHAHHAVELQQLDQRPQLALVRRIGDSLVELRAPPSGTPGSAAPPPSAA